jgi:hypothetical protein
MYYAKSWSGQPDTTTGIGSEWTIVGGSGSGFKQTGGNIGPLDDSTTLARLNMAAATGSEAYTEVVVAAFSTTHEIYIGLATTNTGTDLASAAIYMRATGGRLRLYRKTAASSSLVAIGPTAGNLTRTLVAGDRLRLTSHAGNLTMSVNGTALYSFAETGAATYVYPTIRVKGDAATRFSSVKAADYGIESPPAPPANQLGTIPGLSIYQWRNSTLNPIGYNGLWGGSSVIPEALTYVGAFQGPPKPLARPATMGPDPAMANPPALPSSFVPDRTVQVTNATQLTAALADAQPGDLIWMNDGLYTDVKLNLTDKVGTATKPIVIWGKREVDVRLGTSETDFGSGYVGWLQRCKYIWVGGITMRNGPKGFVLDESNFCWVKGVHIWNIEQEALHFRNFSSDNVAEDNTIHGTGLKSPGFGEAMYNGTANSNWSASTATRPGQADACDRNVFRRNYCYDFTGEGLDIKEGTTGTLCEYNWFDGSSLADDNSADTWVDVKGNDAIIQYNYGNVTYNGGYTVFNPIANSGMRAIFRGNIGNAKHKDGTNTPDPFILVKTPNSGTIVYSNNTYQGSPSLTNIAITAS